jgi:predicted ATPase
MSLELFRKKLREYCHLSGRSQKILAQEIGLHLTTLSHKLNGIGQARLTHTETRQIVKTLAQWGGLNTQAEAFELLELAGLKSTAFSEQEWKTPPLSLLEVSSKVAVTVAARKTETPPIPAPATYTETELLSVSKIEQVPHNLPFLPAPFVGRKNELSEISGMLRRANLRLLTLTGPGGVGKTRLAVSIATSLRQDFAHGVCFVSLAALHDPALVVSTIIQALGLKEAAKLPPDQLIPTLKAFLQDKHLLLVLDNFEQVSSAAPLVSQLLAEAEGLKILVTSRVVLRVYGEHEFVVPPLALPDLKQPAPPQVLAQNEAVALFVQRAQCIKADFRLTEENSPLIAEICTRLDGLPLALELAAARIKLLPPAQLLARLSSRLSLLTGGARDLPMRHQTLRSTIAWSYDLLSSEEKCLFRRMAVFNGGCTLDAAEILLCDPSLDLLEVLASLLDKSMLRQVDDPEGQPRYLMLETLREFALERLDESGEEDDLRQRHAYFFLQLAEQAEKEMEGPHQAEWFDRLENDHDNLRAALDWSMEKMKAEEPDLIHPSSLILHPYKLAGALWRFWWYRGYCQEGRRRLDTLLAQKQTITSVEYKKARLKALDAAGRLAFNQGDSEAAQGFFEESLSIAQELEDKSAIAGALQNLGMVAGQRNDYASLRQRYAESLELLRQLQDKAGLGALLHKLGAEAARQGDIQEAHARYTESLALRRQLGDEVNMTLTLNNLGVLAARQGDYAAARTLFEECLVIKRKLKDRPGMSYLLNNLGLLACKLGDYTTAQARLEEARIIKEQQGDKPGLSYVLNCLGIAARNQGQLEEALSFFELSMSLKHELGDRSIYSTSLNELGHVFIMKGDYTQARTYLDESLALAQEFNDKPTVAESLMIIGLLEYRQGDYGAALHNLEQSLSLHQEQGSKHSMAETLAWMLIVREAQGQAEKAAPLAGTVDRLLAQSGGTLEPAHRLEYETALSRIRVQPGQTIGAATLIQSLA